MRRDNVAAWVVASLVIACVFLTLALVIILQSQSNCGTRKVATMDSLDALKKDLLAEVVKEITERLKFHYNSPEVRALSDQITNSVIKTIGGSTKAADDLKKELDAIDRSSSAQMTELKRTIATLESESQKLQKDLNSLKQEMVEMRKELSRKR